MMLPCEATDINSNYSGNRGTIQMAQRAAAIRGNTGRRGEELTLRYRFAERTAFRLNERRSP